MFSESRFAAQKISIILDPADGDFSRLIRIIRAIILFSRDANWGQRHSSLSENSREIPDESGSAKKLVGGTTLDNLNYLTTRHVV